MGVQWLATRNETTVEVAMVYMAMVYMAIMGVVVVRRGDGGRGDGVYGNNGRGDGGRGDGGRGDGGQTNGAGTVVSWIMMSCLDTIQSIVLINGSKRRTSKTMDHGRDLRAAWRAL